MTMGIGGDDCLVPYGTVTDTTSDPRWVPLVVTARLAEPVIGIDRHPMLLDGPLSWCAVEHAIGGARARGERPRVPPLEKTWGVDFDLPLARWTAPVPEGFTPDPRLLAADPGMVWGWATSRARWTAWGHGNVVVRKKPAVDAVARYTPDRKMNIGQGPHKARATVSAATWVDAVTWHVLGDADGLRDLLRDLTNLGRMTGKGNGRVRTVAVWPGGERDSWRDRPMPTTGGRMEGVRAPHWLTGKQAPC